MDRGSESLIRAALHDLSNTLAGVQGILDLSDPKAPLPASDRARLDAILAEGFTVLQRSRHLALGSRPDPSLEPGDSWRRALQIQVEPQATTFRCRIEVTHAGEPLHDRWPGELLRSWALAVTRQVLPFLKTSAEGLRLHLSTGADARAWHLAWSPVLALPDSLRPDADHQRRDIAAQWALELGRSLGVTLAFEDGAMKATLPRF